MAVEVDPSQSRKPNFYGVQLYLASREKLEQGYLKRRSSVMTGGDRKYGPQI